MATSENTTTTCYRCGKAIKGQMIRTSPPVLLIELRIDFPKAFHPSCYANAEKEVGREMEVK